MKCIDERWRDVYRAGMSPQAPVLTPSVPKLPTPQDPHHPPMAGAASRQRRRPSRWVVVGSVALLVGACGVDGSSNGAIEGGDGVDRSTTTVDRESGSRSDVADEVAVRSTLDAMIEAEAELLVADRPTAEGLVPPATPALAERMTQEASERTGVTVELPSGGPDWSLQSAHRHDDQVIGVVCITFDEFVVRRSDREDRRFPFAEQKVYSLRPGAGGGWVVEDTSSLWAERDLRSCPDAPDHAESCDCEDSGTEAPSATARRRPA